MDYKIGDRVVITKSFEDARKDFAGKIVDIDESDIEKFYGIEFDAFMDGHECDGHARNGFGYYVPSDSFVLEIQPTVHTVEIAQNGGEYIGYAYITCINIESDKEDQRVIYADGMKIEFDEICRIVN